MAQLILTPLARGLAQLLQMAVTLTVTPPREHAHSLCISSAGAHTHSVAIAAAGAHTHAITIGKTGSGAAFSILPPYIAVYMWRRTA